jgi:predicted small metal-binding protein
MFPQPRTKLTVTYLIVVGDPTTTGEGPTVAKVIRCECGHVAAGETDDEVVDAIRAHMATGHPALLDAVDRETLLGWIEDV